MSKYVIDTTLDNVKKVIAMGVTKGGAIWTDTTDIENLEELNSDYINEHFSDLQDTAYQKGFEDGKKEAESSEAIEQAKADAFNKGMLFKEEKINDAFKRGFEKGKAVNDKGCEGCLYNDGAKEHSPCDICRNAYLNRWTAKQTDDEIKVGDVVMIKHPENHLFVVTKVSCENVWGVEGDGSWNYWPINEVIKTDKHFDIDKILEEMRHD